MSDWKNFLVGKTITDVVLITDKRGDKYTRIMLGDTWFEYLDHFTPDEHKLFLAEEALRTIKDECYDSEFANSIAGQALDEMEKF